jgi:hypothetical protein
MPLRARWYSALRPLTFAATLCVPSLASLRAQGPTVAATQSALSRCSYETCAIRLDRSLFGGRRVTVGLDAKSTPMGIGGGLVNAVAAVPQAAEEAQRGRGNSIKAFAAGVIGALAVTWSVSGTGSDALEWNNGKVFGGLALGLAATLTAGQQAVYAERHFSRAVWLYNREIPR